jgi:hypothetical protein
LRNGQASVGLALPNRQARSGQQLYTGDHQELYDARSRERAQG